MHWLRLVGNQPPGVFLCRQPVPDLSGLDVGPMPGLHVPRPLGIVRADLELVRDKAGGRSRSCAQIARNEAEVAKGTKLKREPQAVCCHPRRMATRSRSAPVSVNALIRSSPGISSGKLANLGQLSL